MKTLKRNHLFIIKAFLSALKENIKEACDPELVELAYDFKKNRYHLTATVLLTVASVSEFELEKSEKLVGTYQVDTIADYGDDKIQVSCRPIQFVKYGSPNELVTDRKIIDSVVLPFKMQKGGVQKCVDGLDEVVGVEDVEADEFM